MKMQKFTNDLRQNSKDHLIRLNDINEETFLEDKKDDKWGPGEVAELDMEDNFVIR
jgi:hypothetical protein